MLKKGISLLLVMLMVFAVCTPATFAKEVRKAEAIKGTPVIDGVVDEIWKDAKAYTDFQQTGATVVKTTTDIKPSFKVMWDETNLYFLTEVKDSKVGGTAKNPTDLCNNDSVEIYIDQDNGKLKVYKDDDIWIKADYMGTLQDSSTAYCKNVPAGTKVGASVVSDGYVIEISVPWTAIKPAVGTIIGFEVSWSDNMLGGDVRSTWIHWNDGQDGISPTAYINPSAWGIVELVAAPSAKTADNAAASATSSPKTGDSDYFVYFAAMVLSGAVIFVLKKKSAFASR